MCKVLKFARSSYYKALVGVPSKQALEAAKLKDEIKSIYLDSKSRYGAPKIQKILETKGKYMSLKRVQRYMSSMGIKSIVTKKYRPQSSKSNIETRENRLNQDFKTTNINQKWCTDITYIYTIKNGWTYLASVMDLYSRKILGYSYSKEMTTDLVIKAVKNACFNIKETKGIILHSDMGSQYTSLKYEQYLEVKGIIASYSRKGNPYDNACIESFHSLLKKEEVNQNKYYDFKVAMRAIFEYIESWYNKRRIHSSLEYMTPSDFHDAAKNKLLKN